MEGSIFTKNNVAKQLELANRNYNNQRTWSQLYGAVDLANQLASESALVDFGKAAGEAYRTANANKVAIAGSNLITGNKNLAMLENETALADAYDAYVQNYRNNLEQVNQQTLAGRQAVTDQLMRQAEYTSKYANAHVNYLYELWNKYQSGELPGDIFNDISFANFMKNSSNENGTPVIQDGAPIMELVNRDELNDILYETTIGPDGTPTTQLTNAGVAFFDNMEHNALLGDYTFGDYLSETDEDLYNWAISENPYDYNPNRLGKTTNDATFRSLVGQEPANEQFNRIENFFGLTTGSLEKRYGEFAAKTDAYLEAMQSGKEEDINTSIAGLSAEVKSLLDDFGLTETLQDELESQYGTSDVDEYLKSLFANPEEIKNAFDSPYTNLILMGGIPSIIGIIKDMREPDMKITNEDETAQSFIASIADMAKNLYQQNASAFYNKESTTGGHIQEWDPFASKHDNYYVYLMKDGKEAKFLSNTEYKDRFDITGWDKDNNFVVKYDGVSYKLEASSNETLDANVVSQLANKVSTSMGRPMQEGDIFQYNGHLWVYDGKKVLKIKGRFGNSDYKDLMVHINSAPGVNRTWPGLNYMLPSSYPMDVVNPAGLMI